MPGIITYSLPNLSSQRHYSILIQAESIIYLDNIHCGPIRGYKSLSTIK